MGSDVPGQCGLMRFDGLSEGDQELLLPNGPRDLAALLWRRHDEQALAELGDPTGLKIR